MSQYSLSPFLQPSVGQPPSYHMKAEQESPMRVFPTLCESTHAERRSLNSRHIEELETEPFIIRSEGGALILLNEGNKREKKPEIQLVLSDCSVSQARHLQYETIYSPYFPDLQKVATEFSLGDESKAIELLQQLPARIVREIHANFYRLAGMDGGKIEEKGSVSPQVKADIVMAYQRGLACLVRFSKKAHTKDKASSVSDKIQKVIEKFSQGNEEKAIELLHELPAKIVWEIRGEFYKNTGVDGERFEEIGSTPLNVKANLLKEYSKTLLSQGVTGTEKAVNGSPFSETIEQIAKEFNEGEELKAIELLSELPLRMLGEIEGHFYLFTGLEGRKIQEERGIDPKIKAEVVRDYQESILNRANPGRNNQKQPLFKQFESVIYEFSEGSEAKAIEYLRELPAEHVRRIHGHFYHLTGVQGGRIEEEGSVDSRKKADVIKSYYDSVPSLKDPVEKDEKALLSIAVEEVIACFAKGEEEKAIDRLQDLPAKVVREIHGLFYRLTGINGVEIEAAGSADPKTKALAIKMYSRILQYLPIQYIQEKDKASIDIKIVEAISAFNDEDEERAIELLVNLPAKVVREIHEHFFYFTDQDGGRIEESNSVPPKVKALILENYLTKQEGAKEKDQRLSSAQDIIFDHIEECLRGKNEDAGIEHLQSLPASLLRQIHGGFYEYTGLEGGRIEEHFSLPPRCKLLAIQKFLQSERSDKKTGQFRSSTVAQLVAQAINEFNANDDSAAILHLQQLPANILRQLHAFFYSHTGIEGSKIEEVGSTSCAKKAEILFSFCESPELEDLLRKQEYYEIDLWSRSLSYEKFSKEGRKAENIPYNQFGVVPYDSTRVILSEGTYVNANTVLDRIIMTQCPVEPVDPGAVDSMNNTASRFWKMVEEKQTNVIAMLNGEKGEGTYYHYFPHTPGEVKKFARYTITCEASTTHELEGADGLKLSVTDRTLSLTTSNGEKRTIHHIKANDWMDFAPCDEAMLEKLIELVSIYREESAEENTTVVHCSAGVGRSGVFLSAFDQYQRIMKGEKHDLKTAVTNLRSPEKGRCPHTMEGLRQYVATAQFLRKIAQQKA